MAEVWMDEYKTLFFLYRRSLLTTDIGNVTPRKKLREKCLKIPCINHLDAQRKL